MLPVLVHWVLAEVLVAVVTAVGPEVTHQRVRHAVHLVSAREIRACTRQVVRTRCGLFLVSSKAVALGVTGQELVGGVVQRTYRYRLHAPVGSRRENDAYHYGVAIFSRGIDVELAEIGCVCLAVTWHDSHFSRFEGRAVRGLDSFECNVPIDGKVAV